MPHIEYVTFWLWKLNHRWGSVIKHRQFLINLLVQHDAEMMVFLSPKVSRSPEEAKAILNDVEKRVPNIKAWLNQNEPNKEKVPPKSPTP